MRKRTESLDTFATKTFKLDSGRDVYVYPLSKSESLVPLRSITKVLEMDLQELAEKALDNKASSETSLDKNMLTLKATMLYVHAIFALAVEDPEFIFDTEIPLNTLLLTDDEWFNFSSRIYTECRSRLGRSVYTEDDIAKVAEYATELISKDLAEKKI